MFTLLFDIFGEHFCNNLGIIFTRWDFNKNKENYTKEFNQELQDQNILKNN
jgi:hypothetical protein